MKGISTMYNHTPEGVARIARGQLWFSRSEKCGCLKRREQGGER